MIGDTMRLKGWSLSCARCQKPLRWWQSREPLGGGFLQDLALGDTFGQFEHTGCQTARFAEIEKNREGDRVLEDN